MEAVNLPLHTDMGHGLDLEVAAPFVRVQIGGQRPLDLPGPRVVALNEIRVVAVHDPHEIGQAGGGARMQPGAQPFCHGDELGGQVGQLLAALINEAGFDPGRCFHEVHHADL